MQDLTKEKKFITCTRRYRISRARSLNFYQQKFSWDNELLICLTLKLCTSKLTLLTSFVNRIIFFKKNLSKHLRTSWKCLTNSLMYVVDNPLKKGMVWECLLHQCRWYKNKECKPNVKLYRTNPNIVLYAKRLWSPHSYINARHTGMLASQIVLFLYGWGWGVKAAMFWCGHTGSDYLQTPDL